MHCYSVLKWMFPYRLLSCILQPLLKKKLEKNFKLSHVNT